MITVYKVVKALTDGNLVSAITSSPRFKMRYAPGKKALPPEGTKLFAFDTFQSAQAWIKSMGSLKFEVWQATASRAYYSPLVSKYVSEDEIADYWFDERRFTMLPPEGTMFCDDLILEERLL